MADEAATAKDGEFILVCTLPDVCLTPTRKGDPVPYFITHTMAQSKQCSPNVFFRGKAAYMHEESYVDNVEGDEAGGGKGVVSRTHVEISRSIDKSRNVYVNGRHIVRTGDKVWMNRKEPDMPPPNTGRKSGQSGGQASSASGMSVTASGSADATDVALVEAELAKIPEKYRTRMNEKGVNIVVVRGSVTEHLTELKGVTPRGWPPGTSWDTVPGLARGDTVIIATRGHGTATGAYVPLVGDGHGAYNLVLHEAAHALQNVTGTSKNFLSARAADLAALDAYQSQAGAAGISETFAESFANVFGGNSSYASSHPNLDAYWKNNAGK